MSSADSTTTLCRLGNITQSGSSPRIRTREYRDAGWPYPPGPVGVLSGHDSDGVRGGEPGEFSPSAPTAQVTVRGSRALSAGVFKHIYSSA